MCHDRIMIMSGNSHIPEVQIPAEINETEDYKKLTKILAGTLYNLTKEREKTNELLTNILERINNIEARFKTEEKLVSKVDEEILDFIKKMGKVCAADVQEKFKYRGKNAASSRLNRLYSLGILEKRQAGRVVYYLMKDGYQQ